MQDGHMIREDLVGKTIDIHSHAGIQVREAAQISFPYCSSIEDLAYRQKANSVDVAVVFPISPAFFFDVPTFIDTGKLETTAKPASRAPYERENRLLLTEVYRFCPEHSRRFLPFISVDPGRCVAEQIEVLRELEGEFPIYGVKVSPVACQSRVTGFLSQGAALLDFFAERGWPVLFHVSVSPGEEYSQASDTLAVAERHPELRFCLAHCIGFHREYLDRAATLPNVWVDTAALKIQVQLAREGNELMTPRAARVEADYADHVAVMRTLVERYPHKIVWGSDAPYHSYITRRLQGPGVYAEFRLKGTYEEERAALDGLTASQRDEVQVNARDFLFGR